MLGFRLNEEQEAFRLAVRGFAEKALAPRVDELEETETFPKDLFRELGRLGYLGVGYPEEYGGSGGEMVMRCLLIEDHPGVKLRHDAGVENILWSRDYPHGHSSWPPSRDV